MQAGPVTEVCAAYLGEYMDKIRVCVEQLDAEQLWWRPGPRGNSAGNLLLHLTGCLSQWVLSGLAGEHVERRRPEEFTADRTAGAAELLDGLSAVVARCQAVFRALDAGQLTRPVQVMRYDTDGLGVLLHMMEHTAYHTGQIVQLAKQLLGERGEIDFDKPAPARPQ
jgi:uncharacterized damage-inducible protein DinB